MVVQQTADPDVVYSAPDPTPPESTNEDGTVNFRLDSTRVYPAGSKTTRKVSMPDAKSSMGVAAITVPNEAIKRDGEMFIVTIDPKATYKVNRRVVDAEGAITFERDEKTGAAVLKENDDALKKLEEERKQGASKPKEAPKEQVYNKETVAEVKAKSRGKGKAAVMGAAAGAAAAKAAGKDETKTSIGHKVAKGAGFAAAIAGGAVVAGAVASQTTMRKGFENPIAEGIGQLLMANASQLDRRMPAIGVPPDPKDRRAGYEFDM